MYLGVKKIYIEPWELIYSTCIDNYFMKNENYTVLLLK